MLQVRRGWSPCPENKASASQAPVDQNHPMTTSLICTTPLIGIAASGTGAFKKLVGSSSHPRFPEKRSPTASTVVKKEKREFVLFVICMGKRTWKK